jgi:hypothetical protein
MSGARIASGNVIPLRRLDRGIQLSSRHPVPFDRLTTELVLAQYRAGTLPEAVIVALLAGAGLPSGDHP